MEYVLSRQHSMKKTIKVMSLLLLVFSVMTFSACDDGSSNDEIQTDVPGEEPQIEVAPTPAPQSDTANPANDEVAEADTDSDGIPDTADNCPLVSNADQTDSDGDGSGNACDADNDNDGILDDGDGSGLVGDLMCAGFGSSSGGTQTGCDDNCRFAANATQVDIDSDGIGNICDNDIDGDGILDESDNCKYIINADQANLDTDLYGDVCDFDDDEDGYFDFEDACPYNKDCH